MSNRTETTRPDEFTVRVECRTCGRVFVGTPRTEAEVTAEAEDHAAEHYGEGVAYVRR